MGKGTLFVARTKVNNPEPNRILNKVIINLNTANMVKYGTFN